MEATKFHTKLTTNDLKFYFGHSISVKEINIADSNVYSLVKELLSLAYPTLEDEYDKRWIYFYLPVSRNLEEVEEECEDEEIEKEDGLEEKSELIVIPVSIMEYKNEYHIMIQSFGIYHVSKGNINSEDIYTDIITEIKKFIPIIRKDEKILEELLPYDIRTGKIKGKYVLENILQQSELKTILQSYKDFISKGKEIKEISLNDYLNTSGICYKGAYKTEAEGLSNLEMYKKWADGRDGEMLSIKDWDSKEQFSNWFHGGHIGHPFEIVFSWHRHGIHLFPPSFSSNWYSLRVTNYAYAWNFLEMLKNLINEDIPFRSENLEDVLQYLAGETYFSVNSYEEHNLKYYNCEEYDHYLNHIEWDDIKIVKWKD